MSEEPRLPKDPHVKVQLGAEGVDRLWSHECLDPLTVYHGPPVPWRKDLSPEGVAFRPFRQGPRGPGTPTTCRKRDSEYLNLNDTKGVTGVVGDSVLVLYGRGGN